MRAVGWFPGVLSLILVASGYAKDRVELKDDAAQGQLQVKIDGREAFSLQYGADHDMVHVFPLLSPSGKQLTIQRNDPYPHHRSFWFGDTVELAGGPKASFYQPWYSRVDPKDPKSPFKDQIRLIKFTKMEVTPQGADIAAQLLWSCALGKTPVMDDFREMRIVPLGEGEYFLDCQFKVTASYGDVTFRSDQTHYAWPYFRMHPQFTVDGGKVPFKATKDKAAPAAKPAGTGRITNSEGKIDGKDTCMQPARWVDYSGTVDGLTEGMAVFANPKGPPPKFFTRDYGTFGPRRPDERSGKPFVLKKGESLTQRVGVLVHRGDVKEGRVAERYQQFAEGKL